MQNILVKEIMTTDLVTVNIHENMEKVAKVFKEKNFHHIPIVDLDGCVKGIISLTDFERMKNGSTLFRNPKIEEYNQALIQSMLAVDIMTKDVIELRPTDSIRRAYEIFKKNKFRALPISDKGILVGLVTPLDILDYFFQNETV